LKAPYSDQFSIGMRNKLGDWNTSAAYARINSKDGLAFTLGNRYPDGAFWHSCGATCTSQPWGNGVPGFARYHRQQRHRNEDQSDPLSADKPYTRDSGWSATFAYTYTDANRTATSTSTTRSMKRRSINIRSSCPMPPPSIASWQPDRSMDRGLLFAGN
jgi:hypothetical protein